MKAHEFPDIRCIVILKSDRVHAEALQQYALQVFPSARIVISLSVEAARAALATQPVDLFVAGAGASMEGDVLELLAQSAANTTVRNPRVLIVTVRREYRMLATLRTLAVDGVFDSAAEPPDQLIVAMRTVASGKRFWSQTNVDHLHRLGSGANALFRLLTAFEQLVLSVIGDGCDNVAAAAELRLSPATISTVRRELHRKLGVQHRGELVRVAAQHGFVRFTAGGVVRPGFSAMREAYEARRAKLAQSRPPDSFGGKPGAGRPQA